MNFPTTAALAACAVGLSFTFAPAVPVPQADICYYVQTHTAIDGGCMQTVNGDCTPCCRHLDLPMTIPACSGGNQYKSCPDQNFFFQAEIYYCPGTPPNPCTYLETITCSHYAVGGIAGGVCEQPPPH